MSSDRLQVWELDLDADWQRWSHLLSPDECARARRYVSAVVARRFRAGRAALRLLLGRRCGIDPGALVIGAEALGKPVLHFPVDRDVHFNLSHSGRHGVVAVASFPVGVDVETVAYLNELTTLVEVACSPSERAALQALPLDERTLQFYRLWVRKEAFLKATGSGFHIPPDRVHLERIVSSSNFRAFDIQGDAPGHWQVFDLLFSAPDCVAGLCIDTRRSSFEASPFELAPSLDFGPFSCE